MSRLYYVFDPFGRTYTLGFEASGSAIDMAVAKFSDSADASRKTSDSAMWEWMKDEGYTLIYVTAKWLEARQS